MIIIMLTFLLLSIYINWYNRYGTYINYFINTVWTFSGNADLNKAQCSKLHTSAVTGNFNFDSFLINWTLLEFISYTLHRSHSSIEFFSKIC